MQQIEVDLPHTQPFEAAVAGGLGAAPRGILRQHLADQEHLIAPPLDRFADESFCAAVGIGFRRVDQRQREIDAEPKGRDLLSSPPRILGHVPCSLPKDRDSLTGWKGGGASRRHHGHDKLPSCVARTPPSQSSSPVSRHT
jgi:hypothetical protein